MSKPARGVYAADGRSYLSPDQITDLGIKHGAFRPNERAADLAKAEADPSGVLTTVCRVMAAAGPVTPATPATPGSGPSVAAGSPAPAVYPGTWSRAVDVLQRVSAGVGRQATAQRQSTLPAASGPGVEYPAAFAGAVAAGRRTSRLLAGAAKERARNTVRAAGPVDDRQPHALSGKGYHDKAVR